MSTNRASPSEEVREIPIIGKRRNRRRRNRKRVVVEKKTTAARPSEGSLVAPEPIQEGWVSDGSYDDTDWFAGNEYMEGSYN
ncbi:MAG: 2b protein [Sichuan bromovirus]|nr:MAG: 2b protein [Sichuan bromovirus]